MCLFNIICGFNGGLGSSSSELPSIFYLPSNGNRFHLPNEEKNHAFSKSMRMSGCVLFLKSLVKHYDEATRPSLRSLLSDDSMISSISLSSQSYSFDMHADITPTAEMAAPSRAGNRRACPLPAFASALVLLISSAEPVGRGRSHGAVPTRCGSGHAMPRSPPSTSTPTPSIAPAPPSARPAPPPSRRSLGWGAHRTGHAPPSESTAAPGNQTGNGTSTPPPPALRTHPELACAGAERAAGVTQSPLPFAAAPAPGRAPSRV